MRTVADMQGTSYEVHQLGEDGEPCALRASFNLEPGQTVDGLQSIAVAEARVQAERRGCAMGVFLRVVERVTTVSP